MNGYYTRFENRRMTASINLATASIKALLLRSTGTYVFDPDHDFVADLFTNGGVEITVASYVRKTMTGQTTTLDDTNNRSTWDFDDIAFGNLEVGQTVSAIVWYEFITNDAASPLIRFVDGKIRIVAAAPAAVPTTNAITGATQANPVVVTATGHPFVNGDKVSISGVVGMTQLNGNVYTVANKATNTFELSGINGTGFTAYTSGGTAKLVRVVYIRPLDEPVADGVAVDFGGGATGTINGATAKDALKIEIKDLAAAFAEGAVASSVQSTFPLPAVLGGGAFNVNINAAGFMAVPGGTP